MNNQNKDFQVGQYYSRKDISSHLGGGIMSYRPTVKGDVVATCLNPAFNPDAPHTVLVGKGPTVMKVAAIFARQPSAVPTFVKRKVNQWEYLGRYKVKHQSFDPSEVKDQAVRAGRKDNEMGAR